MTTFRVAVNTRRKGPDGQPIERTDWFRVRTMGQRAEYASRLPKGSRVLVEGRLDIGEYQGRDGQMKTSYDIWADELVNLSGWPESEANDNAAGQPAASRGGARPTDEDGVELPF
jgi:single-strand DNA-binding protein